MAHEAFTIVGARGFIGAALAERLHANGHDVRGLSHTDALPAGPLGHVVYASGIAAAAAGDAAYAYAIHVEGLRRIIAAGNAASLLYLSSTRVYGASERTQETVALAVDPNAGDVYRVSKIAGEALCLAVPLATFRVARLSNVIGPSVRSPLFFSDVARQAAATGRIHVRTTPDSAKDYLAIDDACRYLAAIALGGRERLYNVAFGANVENGPLLDALARASGARIEVAPGASRAVTPPIDVRRLQREFGPPATAIIDAVPAFYAAFEAHART